MRIFFLMLLADGYAAFKDNDNEKSSLVGGGKLSALIAYLKLKEVKSSEIVFVNIHKKIQLKIIKSLLFHEEKKMIKTKEIEIIQRKITKVNTAIKYAETYKEFKKIFKNLLKNPAKINNKMLEIRIKRLRKGLRILEARLNKKIVTNFKYKIKNLFRKKYRYYCKPLFLFFPTAKNAHPSLEYSEWFNYRNSDSHYYWRCPWQYEGRHIRPRIDIDELGHPLENLFVFFPKRMVCIVLAKEFHFDCKKRYFLVWELEKKNKLYCEEVVHSGFGSEATIVRAEKNDDDEIDIHTEIQAKDNWNPLAPIYCNTFQFYKTEKKKK